MIRSNNYTYSLIAAGSVIAAMGFAGCNSNQQKETKLPERPNILILYADDLGFGDLSCYGAIGLETPHIDRLAKHGVKFTDAHCAAATCSPSRYSLLTGNYAFRGQVDILPGDAPLLIRPGTPTLATALGSIGYKSAVIGKWHLGMGDGDVDWNTDIKPGPLEIGFDYSFIIPATNDRVPSVYVENHRVYGADPSNPMEITFTDNASDPNPYGNPTGLSHPELVRQRGDIQHSGVIVNGVPRIGFMGGGEQSWWRDEDFPEIFTRKAIDFIDSTGDDPFFMFFAFNEIHVPRIPNERFVGKSTMGPRGDAIVQMDYMVGVIIAALEERGLTENTLVIFSSDNGPVLDDGYADQSIELLGDHKPAGPFRGGKYSIFEGGNRMPTITYWPGVVEEGQVNNALWTQTDFFTSFARLAGYEIPEGHAVDSEDLLDVILGKSDQGREYLLQEALRTYALRQGKWKYILPTEGFPAEITFNEQKKIEFGRISIPQLYNLDEDPGEQFNLAEKFPEKIKELKEKLMDIQNMEK